VSLFDRYIEVVLYASNEDSGVLTTINSNALDIDFDVTKTNDGESNKGEVGIFGLSPDLIELIKSSRPASLILKAGYRGDKLLNNLYVGDISEVKLDKEGADIKTILTVATALTSTRSLPVSKSWGGVVTLTDIINHTIFTQKLTLKQPVRYREHTWNRGMSLSGNVIESLKKIVTNLGMEITIDDNIIDIWNKSDVNRTDFVVISAQTGMIGIPEAMADINDDRVINNAEMTVGDNPNELDDKNKTIITDGYKITTLINAKLTPNARISLTSEKVKADNSLMTVDAVRHYGSNYDKDFYSEAICFNDESSDTNV